MSAISVEPDLASPNAIAERQLRWASLRSWTKRGLIVGTIGGIFVLSKPLIVMAALAACCAVFACYSLRRSIHWVGIGVILNFAFWLASGLLTGAVVPGAFASKEFWRGEGRCFLFYIPLLAFSVIRFRTEDLRFVVRFVAILTIIGLLLSVLWMAGMGHLFQSHENEETGEIEAGDDYFIGLQTSHSGAGAFWATMTGFLAAYSVYSGKRLYQGLALGAAFLTFTTGGRAATLGLMAVMAWLLLSGKILNRKTIKYAAPVALAVGLGGWGVVLVAPEIGERMLEVFQGSTVKAVVHTYEEPTLENAAGHFHSGANLENHNIVIRIFLWKYAFNLFRNSPLLGIGFGRFNDADLQFSGIPGLLNFATDGYRFIGSGIEWDDGQLMVSTGNAHNSYFHLLAELGLVGFGLVMLLWWQMYKWAKPLPVMPDDQLAESYCAGCRAAIVSLLTASLFGHALGAPSAGVLITPLVGAWIAHRNWVRSQGLSPANDGL